MISTIWAKVNLKSSGKICRASCMSIQSAIHFFKAKQTSLILPNTTHETITYFVWLQKKSSINMSGTIFSVKMKNMCIKFSVKLLEIVEESRWYFYLIDRVTVKHNVTSTVAVVKEFRSKSHCSFDRQCKNLTSPISWGNTCEHLALPTRT